MQQAMYESDIIPQPGEYVRTPDGEGFVRPTDFAVGEVIRVRLDKSSQAHPGYCYRVADVVRIGLPGQDYVTSDGDTFAGEPIAAGIRMIWDANAQSHYPAGFVTGEPETDDTAETNR